MATPNRKVWFLYQLGPDPDVWSEEDGDDGRRAVCKVCHEDELLCEVAALTPDVYTHMTLFCAFCERLDEELTA